MNPIAQNKDSPLDVSTLNNLPISNLQNVPLHLFDNIDDINFEISVRGSHLESPNSSKHDLQRAVFKQNIQGNQLGPQDNSNGTSNSMTTLPGSTSIEGLIHAQNEGNKHNIYTNEMNSMIPLIPKEENLQGNRILKQEYHPAYEILGLDRLFKAQSQDINLHQEIEKRRNEEMEGIYLGNDSQIVPEDSASQTETTLLHKKRGRKPGQKVKPRKKKGEEDDEDYQVDEDQENEVTDEKDEEEFMKEDLIEEELDAIKSDEGENKLGRGNTNERREYTAYEDAKILEATEDYIEKNGARGLQSITMWQQLKDPQTGDLVLKGMRSFESMRDRYKRYIMLLNKEDKEKIREFVNTHTVEEQKAHHSLFKKVNKRRKFIGISAQLNYDPERIKRHTPYNTKFATVRLEKMKLKALQEELVPKKKRGRKKKISPEEIKRKIEMGFVTGRDDITDINNPGYDNIKGENNLEDDISNFNESQLVNQPNQYDMFSCHETNQGSFHNNDEFRFLKTSKRRNTLDSKKGENSNSKESFEDEMFQHNEPKSRLGKRQMPLNKIEEDYMERGANPTKKICKEEAVEIPKKKRGRKRKQDPILVHDQNSFNFADESNQFGFERERIFNPKLEEYPQYDTNPRRFLHNEYRENPQDGFFGNYEQGFQSNRYSDSGSRQATDMVSYQGNREQGFNTNSRFRRGQNQGDIFHPRPNSFPLKNIRFENEIRSEERKASDVFYKKPPPEEFRVLEIKILADYVNKSRQFVREVPEKERSQEPPVPPFIIELAKKYGHTVDQVLNFYSAVSCNNKDLEEYLQTKRKDLLWNAEEDQALRNNSGVNFLIGIKGKERVEARMDYLMQK